MFQLLFETCIFVILYFLCFYSFLCFRYALSSSRVQSMYLLSFFFFFLSLIVIYYECSKNAFYISFALLPFLVTTLPRKQFLINFFYLFLLSMGIVAKRCQTYATTAMISAQLMEKFNLPLKDRTF